MGQTNRMTSLACIFDTHCVCALDKCVCPCHQTSRNCVIPFSSASRDEEPVPEEYGEGPLHSLFEDGPGWRWEAVGK